MFARPRFPTVHTPDGDDLPIGMAHAMGCATVVDAPRATTAPVAHPSHLKDERPAGRLAVAAPWGLR